MIKFDKELLKKAMAFILGPSKPELIDPTFTPKPTSNRTASGLYKIGPNEYSTTPPRQATVQAPQGIPQASPTPTPLQMAQQIMARNPNVKNYNITPEVERAITSASSQYGVPASLLGDIALQESSFNPTLRNPEEGVTAAGLFQFNDPTWDTVMNYAKKEGTTLKLPNNDRMDPNTAAMAAAYLIKNGQLGRWDASKGVWGTYYKPEELTSYYSQTKR